MKKASPAVRTMETIRSKKEKLFSVRGRSTKWNNFPLGFPYPVVAAFKGNKGRHILRIPFSFLKRSSKSDSF